MTTKLKQPSEVVDYDIDMIEYFDEISDDQIDSAVISVEPAGLVLGPPGHPVSEKIGDPAHVLKVWVGGGVDGQKYRITAVITTVFSRVEEIEFDVKIKET